MNPQQPAVTPVKPMQGRFAGRNQARELIPGGI